MGLFDNFPFSNRHELNLDWILQTMKNALAQVEQGERRIQDVIRGYVIPGQGVGTNELHDGAVTSPKLANGAVTADRIASGAVTSDKIVNGAVGSGKIPTGAIYGYHIRDHEVSIAKLGAFGAGNAGKMLAVAPNGNAELIEIDPDTGVVAVNGKSGVVNLVPVDIGAAPASVVQDINNLEQDKVGVIYRAGSNVGGAYTYTTRIVNRDISRMFLVTGTDWSTHPHGVFSIVTMSGAAYTEVIDLADTGKVSAAMDGRDILITVTGVMQARVIDLNGPISY